MRKLASAIAVIVSIGMPALAADMAVKAPPPAAPVAPVVNWTGFYVGGNLGGVAEHASGTSDFLDTCSAGCFPFGGFPTNPQSNSFSSTRLLGGVQAGYNWQFNPQWLVGVEGDWDWTNTGYSFCRQTNQLSAPCFNKGFGFENFSSKTDWLATARGRLGFVWGRDRRRCLGTCEHHRDPELPGSWRLRQLLYFAYGDLEHRRDQSGVGCRSWR